MIFTAILTMIVIWCLFYTVIPNVILISICVLLGISFATMNNHKHEGHLSIDVIAQSSKLNEVSPSVKFWTVLILIVKRQILANSNVKLFI